MHVFPLSSYILSLCITMSKAEIVSPPESIHAIICDLNGNPLHPNNPARNLRRTTSDHLFRPWNGIVKAVEITNRVPVAPLKDIDTHSRPVRKVEVIQEPEATLRTTRVRSRSSRASGSSEKSLASWYNVLAGEVRGCGEEVEGLRCATQELKSGQYAVGDDVGDDVSPSPDDVNAANDVWTQIAHEE
jgi:hypothetical protein